MREIEQKDVLEIYLYDDIESDGRGFSSEGWESETSAKTVHKRLADADPNIPVHLHINSCGGNVREGVAIHSLLKQHQGSVTVFVDGFACSAASLVAMAGDRVFMARAAMMMIHNPWTVAAGNAAELRKAADDLEKIGDAMRTAYAEKTAGKLSDDRIRELMDAETWLNAEECVAYGLADEVLFSDPAAALEAAKRQAAASLKRPAPEAPDPKAKNNAERLMRAFKKMEGLL